MSVGTSGRHAICEFWGAKHLDSPDAVRDALTAAVDAGKCTLIKLVVHEFSPVGVTGVAVIAESHLSVHTWPEEGYAAVDFYTCGDTVVRDDILPALVAAFEPERVEIREFERGVPTGLRRTDRFDEQVHLSPIAGSYALEAILEERKTPYQVATVFESPGMGRVLALDGTIQHTDLDTYAYHEVLAHPALHAHPNPRTVAIVGGGDVHLAAEVLKHPDVERVLLLELDADVIELASRYWPAAAAALADPRLEVRAGDAFESIPTLKGELDVILADLTDPVGPAARLFEGGFYGMCHEALRADGIFVAQTESLHLHRDTVQSCYKALSERFARTELLWTAMASYPGAFWSFVLASKEHDARQVRRRPAIATKLYDADAHEWFFVPPVVRDKLLA